MYGLRLFFLLKLKNLRVCKILSALLLAERLYIILWSLNRLTAHVALPHSNDPYASSASAVADEADKTLVKNANA